MMSNKICASCGDPYFWIIDRDHIADPKARMGTNDNAASICGGDLGLTVTPEKYGFALGIRPSKFVIKDDDGISYYSGTLWAGCGFEPLDDFGQPNAGATEIWIDGKLL